MAAIATADDFARPVRYGRAAGVRAVAAVLGGGGVAATLPRTAAATNAAQVAAGVTDELPAHASPA